MAQHMRQEREIVMKKIKRKKTRKNPMQKRIRLIAVSALLVLVFLFLVLFKLDNIEVVGNSRFSDEQIKNYCINESGFNNTLIYYLMHRKTVTDDVPLLDYVETVYVNRNTIQLVAHEKQAVGMYQVDDQMYCIDQEGMVIEIVSVDDSTSLGLSIINNLCSTAHEVGESIETDDKSVLYALQALKSTFEKYNMTAQSIDIGENSDGNKTYTMHFGNITIPLGEDKLLEEKMKRVAAILPKLEGKSGTLHLEYFDDETENIVFNSTEVTN